jgi:hypothetical protein
MQALVSCRPHRLQQPLRLQVQAYTEPAPSQPPQQQPSPQGGEVQDLKQQLVQAEQQLLRKDLQITQFQVMDTVDAKLKVALAESTAPLASKADLAGLEAKINANLAATKQQLLFAIFFLAVVAAMGGNVLDALKGFLKL